MGEQRMIIDHLIVKCGGCGTERSYYPDAEIVGAEALIEWLKTGLERCACGYPTGDVKAHVRNAEELGFPIASSKGGSGP